MSDLFISYSHHDRPWAERLYKDIRTNHSFLDVFWDRESIPPRATFREILNDEIRKANNLVLLWSEAAKQSDEVGPEVQTFQAFQAQHAAPGVKAPIAFYIPLEGKYGPLEATQGFTAMRDHYKKD